MKLSIIVLNYKTPDLTIKCLESLEKQYSNKLKDNEIEVIVVDNASGDGSFNKLRLFSKNKSYLRVIESSENLGFAGGCNLGAQASGSEYLLFLNSDTNVFDNGILRMLDKAESDPQVAIIGGRLENRDGTTQPSTGVFYTLPNLIIMLLGGQRLGLLKTSPKHFKKVDWVSGACLLIKKDIFNMLSGFDRDYFMYVEDMDLSYRAKELGYETYFFPDVKIKHMGEGSSNRTFAVFNIYKNILLFYKKQMGELQYAVAYFCLFLKAFLIYTIGRITRKPYFQNTYGEALKLFR